MQVSTAALRGLRFRRALSLGLVVGLALGLFIEILIIVFPAIVRGGPKPDGSVLGAALPWAGGVAAVAFLGAVAVIWFTQPGKILPAGTGSTLIVPNLVEVAISGGTVNEPEKNWAVFVDLSNITLGENNSSQLTDGELQSALDWLDRQYDHLFVRQAYGDYSVAIPGSDKLGILLRQRGFTLAHMPRLQKGAEKNHSDIQLAVDAALIARARPDIGGYIIMSGDGDYTPLLLQLRTLGRRIHVIAREKSVSAALAAQADIFTSLDSIIGRDHLTLTAIREGLVKLRTALVSLDAKQIPISTIALPHLLRALGQDVTAFGFLDVSAFLTAMTRLGVLRINQTANGMLLVLPGDVAPGDDALDRLLQAVQTRMAEAAKHGSPKFSPAQVLDPILKAQPALEEGMKKAQLATMQIISIAERLNIVVVERAKTTGELVVTTPRPSGN